MLSVYINLGIGVCLSALLLLVFFRSAGKNRKQRMIERELILNLGDDGLLHLYDQAETDNEREGIVEFAKEKLTSKQPDSQTSLNIMPAGLLDTTGFAPPETLPEADTGDVTAKVATDETIFIPHKLADETAEKPLAGIYTYSQEQAEPAVSEIPIPANMPITEAMPQMKAKPQAQAMPRPKDMPQMAAPGLAKDNSPAHPTEHADLAQNERRQINGMLTSLTEEDLSAHTPQTQTHELPLDKMDWTAVEKALEKKRDEYARIMAHNQLIQNVFSKIQSVEDSVVGSNREHNEQ